MSDDLNRIVDIQISRQTQTVKRANFGTVTFIDEFDPGSSPPFSGRTKEYGSLTELTGDGYQVGDYVYDSATKALSQNPSPNKIKVAAKFITSTPDASWTATLNAWRARRAGS